MINMADSMKYEDFIKSSKERNKRGSEMHANKVNLTKKFITEPYEKKNKIGKFKSQALSTKKK